MSANVLIDMLNLWRCLYLCFGMKEQHPILADADQAWRGTGTVADLLGEENVGAKIRHGGQNLWKTWESDIYSFR